MLKDKIDIAKLTYFLLFIAISIRFIRFGSFPAGMQIDEMGSAIDAYCLLTYGTDRYGFSFPVYFTNYGEGQSALYVYMCAVSVYLFGFNEIAIRLPALINSILLAVFGFKLIGVIWNDLFKFKTNYAQLLYVILYAISPYCFMSARFGLDCNLMLGISTTFLYFICRAIGEQSERLFFISGVTGGFVLYTYVLSHAVMPIFLTLTLIYLILLHRLKFKYFFLFAVPIFLMATPLLLMHYVNIFNKETMQIGMFTINQLPFYRGGAFSVSHMPYNAYLVLKSGFAYDWIDYNTIKKFWTFYPVSVLFAAIGIVCCFKNTIENIRLKKFSGIVLIVFWFMAELLLGSMINGSGYIIDVPNTNKINGILFTGMFFIICGLSFFINLFNNQRKKICLVLIVSVYTVYSILFFRFYFTNYQPNMFWSYAFTPLLENNPKITIDTTFFKQLDSLHENNREVSK